LKNRDWEERELYTLSSSEIKKREDELTSLSLQFNLVSNFTSFVAIEDENIPTENISFESFLSDEEFLDILPYMAYRSVSITSHLPSSIASFDPISTDAERDQALENAKQSRDRGNYILSLAYLKQILNTKQKLMTEEMRVVREVHQNLLKRHFILDKESLESVSQDLFNSISSVSGDVAIMKLELIRDVVKFSSHKQVLEKWRKMAIKEFDMVF